MWAKYNVKDWTLNTLKKRLVTNVTKNIAKDCTLNPLKKEDSKYFRKRFVSTILNINK